MGPERWEVAARSPRAGGEPPVCPVAARYRLPSAMALETPAEEVAGSRTLEAEWNAARPEPLPARTTAPNRQLLPTACFALKVHLHRSGGFRHINSTARRCQGRHGYCLFDRAHRLLPSVEISGDDHNEQENEPDHEKMSAPQCLLNQLAMQQPV